MTPTPALLLDVRDLVVEFTARGQRQPFKAVDGVSFNVSPDETVGIVGESGSGKTTLGRSILGLAPIAGGSIHFDGEDITRASRRRRRQLSLSLQAVFQDPYSSLNPTRTVGQTLNETARVHARRGTGQGVIDERVRTVLERVGLPAEAALQYPSRFSGGQRQRISLARALIVEPRLIICDEPLSALDLSVQAQVLNLFRELQDEMHLSYVFIAHDLDVVRFLADRVLVMYRGRIIEEGSAEAILQSPAHPYTRALIDSAPVPDPELQRARRHDRPIRTGSDSSLESSATGCPFAPRCVYATDTCWTQVPPPERTPRGTTVSCHRWREIDLDASPPSRQELAAGSK